MKNDDVQAGVVGFVIAWCLFGVLGLIPWNHNTNGGDWQWHMSGTGAWLIWALFVTLGATAFGFAVYAVKRWPG